MPWEIILAVGGTLISVGAIWGDLRSKLKEIFVWRDYHMKESRIRDDRISELKQSHARIEVYMKDNRELLQALNRKVS